MKKLLMIGPAPTRIGGVSIHIKRLADLLKSEFEFDYIDEMKGEIPGYFNLRSFSIIGYLKKIKHADIVHIHSGVFILRCVHIIVAALVFRKKTIVSIHHDLTVEGHIAVTKRLLKLCKCAILDSKEIYNQAASSDSECKYYQKAAFLPPLISSEEVLPAEIVNWIQNIKSVENSILMCSSTANLVLYNDQDLYGTDMCIESVIELNKMQTEKQYYLVLIISRSDQQKPLLKVYKEMVQKNGDDHILIWDRPTSFLRIMDLSEIVLRPTNTDGDSLTVREALYFGKQIVVSDVVERPEGSIVFKSRNLDDMCEKILNAPSTPINRIPAEDYKYFYLNCYNN